MEKSIKEKNEKQKLSHYIPNKIRAEPFKWINFPIFVGIWFALFWFIICPIVWSKVFMYEKGLKPHWTPFWPYYFWGVALILFCIIMGILILIWKLLSPKSENKYNQVFSNPQYGDGNDIYCNNCKKYHAPGKDKCNVCYNCGNEKQSFDKCCENKKTIQEIPPQNVVLRKQPELKDGSSKRYSRSTEKRNSLKNRNSSSSGVLISMHDSTIKDLVNRNAKIEKAKNQNNLNLDGNNLCITNQNNDIKIKKRKPPNLKPVDIELANKETKLKAEFMVKNECENAKTAVKNIESDQPEAIDTPSYDVTEIDSMNADNFNKYLHLVEINTPFTPPECTDNESTNEVAKSPLSPREIFFYDLIQAAEKSDTNNSPDSVILGQKLEKKRPVSHILLTSDINLDTETDEEKMKKLKSKTLGHEPTTKNNSEAIVGGKVMDEEPKFTVKVLQTVKKTIINGETVQTTVVEEKKIYIPKINDNTLSEQNSAQDLCNLKKESVSRYFIKELNRVPTKPSRMTSQVDSVKDMNEECTLGEASPSDNVFDD